MAIFINYVITCVNFPFFNSKNTQLSFFLKLCGVTSRIDRVKIDVLQKGLNMRGTLTIFFNRKPKLEGEKCV